MPRLFISAAHKSSGKTTIATGITAALARQGKNVGIFKKGPDFIDPMWLGAAAGRACYNLDFNTMSETEILGTFARYDRGTDISVIEGNKGLYDGLDLDGSNSNAAMAALLDAPVVLILDARGMTRGIAPLILGYQAFGKDIRIGGVILNRIGGSRHEGKLRNIIEHYTDIPVVGSVHNQAALEISERHLGLIPSNEAEHATAIVSAIADVVAKEVDLDAIVEIAGSVQPIKATKIAAPSKKELRVRIAIARDSSFGFYYPDDLAAFEAAGAELVPFNTLTDPCLPDADGLFIGGGFPECHLRALEANIALRAHISDAIEAGLPTYAECGGLMYLARSISWRGEKRKMVGVIPGDAVMHQRPQGRGYTHIRETGQGLWPLKAGKGGTADFMAHEFHYASLENLEGEPVFAFDVLRGVGVDGEHDGIVYKNVLAGFAHQRNTKANPWVDRFVEFVARCKRQLSRHGQAMKAA
jgi:cobyrinic acid a,c-diamide synthase